MRGVPKVVGETEGFVVVDKPAGLIVHSDGRTVEPSLADWILEHYPALASVGEPWISPQGESVACPGIAHRLDRTTSGVMLIAKTPEAYTELKRLFKERKVKKIYLAYVYGRMEKEEGRIVAEIMRSSTPPKKWYAEACDESNPRAAITEWRLLKKLSDPATGEPVSYIEARPLTGRTHQIRVHLASIGHGHPIVGDHLYASVLQNTSIENGGSGEGVMGFERPALHASSVSFEFGGAPYTFSTPLPPDFAAVSPK